MKIFPDLKEIKYLRKKLDISQEELGKIINVNQTTIYRIENEKIDPPYSKVKKLFEFLEHERMIRKKTKRKAVDIMTKNPITITPKSTIKKAVELMNKYNISQLPIIFDNKNLGSITSKKIQKVITDNYDLINAEVELISELPFPEIEKDWDVKDISNLLANYPAVLVKELGIYIGIIADADLLKLA
ncbi:MAG: CBS domain-containing protein [Promethearchaeota archaeon]|nr:MAG: CBS domain-containing protein [Candidatus Lokiarchaeota archaeon]